MALGSYPFSHVPLDGYETPGGLFPYSKEITVLAVKLPGSVNIPVPLNIPVTPGVVFRWLKATDLSNNPLPSEFVYSPGDGHLYAFVRMNVSNITDQSALVFYG